MLMVMFLDGFVGGFVQNIVTNFTKDDVGHIKITTAAYRQGKASCPSRNTCMTRTESPRPSGT
jgi:hypothetical protein